jgi:hypothetical protein
LFRNQNSVEFHHFKINRESATTGNMDALVMTMAAGMSGRAA